MCKWEKSYICCAPRRRVWGTENKNKKRGNNVNTFLCWCDFIHFYFEWSSCTHIRHLCVIVLYPLLSSPHSMSHSILKCLKAPTRTQSSCRHSRGMSEFHTRTNTHSQKQINEELDENEWSTYVRALLANEMENIKTEITCATVLMWNYYYTLTAKPRIISAIESECVCVLKDGRGARKFCTCVAKRNALTSDYVRFLLRISNFISNYRCAFKTPDSMENYIRIYFAHLEMSIQCSPIAEGRNVATYNFVQWRHPPCGMTFVAQCHSHATT